MAKSPAWQRAEGKNPEGGLNEKGRASLRAAGHDIKRPQPEGGSRKDSFCARMKGMKAKLTSSETANDPDSRINKSLRKWNCHADGGAVDVARSYRADGGRARYSTGGEPTARDYRQEIADIYQNFLGRDADQGGHDYWTEVLQSGKSSANQVRDAMAGSNEGRLNEIFKAELGRNADLEGRNFWLSANNGSPDWAQIRDQIAGSQEARNRASNVLSDASKGRLFNDPESALAALMWSEGDELRGWGQSHDQADLARRNLAGIGWTARNRAAADFRENMSKSYQSQYDPRNIVNQIYAPSAYSHFAGNREGMAASAFAKNPELENYYRAIAKDILSNNLEDPTQGAVSYYNPNRAATPDFAGAKGPKLGWYETGDLGSRAAGSPQYHVFYGQNDYTPKAVSFYGGDPLNIVDPNYPTYSADNVPYPAPRPPEYGVDFAGVVAGDYPTSSDGYAPTTHAPVTHAPVTHAPTTHAPVTHAPVTHAPTTHAGSGSVSFGPDVSSNYGVTHGISPTVHHTSASDPYFGHGWSGSDYSYGQSMFGHNMHFNPQTGQWMDQAQALHTDPSFDRQRGGRAVDIARSYRKAGGPVWDRPRPKSLGKPEKLSPDEKASAKAAAKAAGRPYPNLVDNMRAAREDGGRLSPFMEAKIREIGDAELGKYGIGPNAPSSTKDELKAGPEQSTWESIAEKAMGDRPSPERRRFVEGMGTAADVAHMGSYLTPLAPYVGAVDFARGVASGDPMEAALGATGLPGKGAKAAGMAASAMMPESAEAGPLGKALQAIRAYHGSPHKFDKFDISKIGTGEGAQAYGHGLYFAGNEGVARSYRDALAHKADPRNAINDIVSQFVDQRVAAPTNENLKWWLSQDEHMKPYAENPQIVSRLREIVQGHEPGGTVSDTAMHSYRELENLLPDPSKGHMYEVDIHANPEHMLDWDKPLLQQSRHVIDRFNDAVAPVRDADDAMLRELFGDKSAHTSLNLFDRSKGSQAYNTFAGERGGPSAVSERLREAGIPGIKYLDQGSRGSGEGTSNYVVFDPNIIEILRRYKDGGRVEKAGGGGLLEKALLALHNMRSHRLGMTEKLGGLPVPSIAITKPEHGFKGYGDITMVGGKEFATPARGNPVFASDVYSPRFPSLDDEGNRIFRGYTPMGNRRYAPVTMENVVREMKGNIRGGESFNYGAGNVRAAVTPQFRTLSALQAARDKIIPESEFRPLKEKANEELFSLADRFRPYSRYSNSEFGHAGSFAETLSDIGRGRHGAWNQDYKDLPGDLKSEAMQYLSRLKNMPTEYFEAKPQRGVELGEFAGAVVPENIMKDVEPRLKNLGVREIVPFNPKEEGAQQKALREFSGLHFSKGGKA
jgi:hypothetical protein